QVDSRRTRALTCSRRRSASTTPAARCSCTKLTPALITRSVPTTMRSVYFPIAAEITMISSSIQADKPQNLLRNTKAGCLFFSATSLKPFSFRRVSTSARVRPISAFTLSAASVSGIDAEAMSGGLTFTDFDCAGSVCGIFPVDCMEIFSRTISIPLSPVASGDHISPQFVQKNKLGDDWLGSHGRLIQLILRHRTVHHGFLDRSSNPVADRLGKATNWDEEL